MEAGDRVYRNGNFRFEIRDCFIGVTPREALPYRRAYKVTRRVPVAHEHEAGEGLPTPEMVRNLNLSGSGLGVQPRLVDGEVDYPSGGDGQALEEIY